METLLPSEIARLVLGYLQEQKCEEAAKAFLETSPLLTECLSVAKKGRKYATNVGGLSLTTILDKHCAMNSLILDKLGESPECEQLRQSNDSLAQLKYLLEESRGNRFVVNIKVPPQNSPGNSKTSSRKRNLSIGEQGKSSKLSEISPEKSIQKDTSRIDKSFENVPLHATSTPTKLTDTEGNENNIHNQFQRVSDENTSMDKRLNTVEKNLNFNLETPRINSSNTLQKNEPKIITQPNNLETFQEKCTESTSVEKCTAGTSTERLMDYCSTEAQTIPLQLLEPAPRVSDESVQNVSLISQGIIQHAELTERIAENINKSIQSAVATNTNESYVGSILTVDNAIKSIVEATNTDPALEELINQIFEIDNTGYCQVEHSNLKPNLEINDQLESQKDTILENQNAEAVRNIVNAIARNTANQRNDQHISSKVETPTTKEVLETSINSQSNGEQVSLSEFLIYNKNSPVKNDQLPINYPLAQTSEPVLDPKASHVSDAQVFVNTPIESSSEFIPDVPQNNEIILAQNVKNVKKDEAEDTSKKSKTKTKKKRPSKPKSSKIDIIDESNVPTVPTLIVCPREEETKMNKYLPICPKAVEQPAPSIFLKTVNVPKHLLTPAQIQANNTNSLVQKTLGLHASLFSPQKQALFVSPQKPIIISPQVSAKKLIVPTPLKEPIILPMTQNNSASPIDSITLYSTKDGTEMRVAPIANIPIISLDDLSLNFAGTGLSPFFKLTGGNDLGFLSDGIREESEVNQQPNSSKKKDKIDDSITILDKNLTNNYFEDKIFEVESPSNLSQKEIESVEKNLEKLEEGNHSKLNIADVITKNTPRSLMLSRSQNGRLSLSTPRRRNSHVRALNFNTPMKLGSNNASSEPSEKVKSACRGSLFKSPPFSGEVPAQALESIPEETTPSSESKILSSEKRETHPQVAPVIQNHNKIHDNTAKVSVVNENSIPPKISSEKSQNTSSSTLVHNSDEKKSISKRSWDEDLRKIIGSGANEENKIKQTTKKSRKKSVTTDAEPDNEDKEIPKKGRKRKLLKEQNINENQEINEVEENNEKKKKSTKKTKNEGSAKKKYQVKTPKGKKLNKIEKKSESKEAENDQKKANEITPPASITNKKTSTEKSSSKKEYFKSPETLNLKFEGPSAIHLDLETPQKTDSELTIPATPRIHYTPAESLIKSCRSSKYTDKSVDTPYLTGPPKTPNIILTPKIIDDDNDKKPSPYYEPSEETKPKETIEAEKIMVQETETMGQKNIILLTENKVVEITKFGIIDSQKVTKDASSRQEVIEDGRLEMTERSAEETSECVNSSAHTDSDSDNESVKSNTSSSSSSSSSSSGSSSSSSSSNSSSSNSSKGSRSDSISPNKENKSFNELEGSKTIMETPLTDHETEESEIELRLQQDSSHDELSPRKMFPPLNLSEESIQETPIKNDNAVLEASISETPTVSDAERAKRRDSLTDHTTKISAIIKTCPSNRSAEKIRDNSTDKKELYPADLSTTSSSKKLNTPNKPKIISIQTIVSPSELRGTVDPTVLESLEQKRKRVMAKLVAPKNNKTNQKNQNVNTKLRKSTTAKKVSSDTKSLKTESMIQKNKEEKQDKNNIESKSEKIRTSPRKKNKKNVSTCGAGSHKVEVVNSEKNNSIVTQKNEKEVAGSIIPTENSKGISKAKVDQVKRDLFTDEEVSNQRTTRSQSARRTLIDKKNEDHFSTNASPEKVPVVLECLELMPANKNNQELDTNLNKTDESDNISPINVTEESFSYNGDNELIDQKKSEILTALSYYNEYLSNREMINVDLSQYVEVFAFSPSSSQSISPKVTNQKIQTSKRKKDKTLDKNELETVNIEESDKNLKTNNKKSLPEKKKKASKRKMTDTSTNSDDPSKKCKVDPHTLFKNIKIDEFLKTLHNDSAN